MDFSFYNSDLSEKNVIRFFLIWGPTIFSILWKRYINEKVKRIMVDKNRGKESHETLVENLIDSTIIKLKRMRKIVILFLVVWLYILLIVAVGLCIFALYEKREIDMDFLLVGVFIIFPLMLSYFSMERGVEDVIIRIEMRKDKKDLLQHKYPTQFITDILLLILICFIGVTTFPILSKIWMWKAGLAVMIISLIWFFTILILIPLWKICREIINGSFNIQRDI